jgi:hypothetical protein
MIARCPDNRTIRKNHSQSTKMVLISRRALAMATMVAGFGTAAADGDQTEATLILKYGDKVVNTTGTTQRASGEYLPTYLLASRDTLGGKYILIHES